MGSSGGIRARLGPWGGGLAKRARRALGRLGVGCPWMVRGSEGRCLRMSCESGHEKAEMPLMKPGADLFHSGRTSGGDRVEFGFESG